MDTPELFPEAKLAVQSETRALLQRYAAYFGIANILAIGGLYLYASEKISSWESTAKQEAINLAVIAGEKEAKEAVESFLKGYDIQENSINERFDSTSKRLQELAIKSGAVGENLSNADKAAKMIIDEYEKLQSDISVFLDVPTVSRASKFIEKYSNAKELSKLVQDIENYDLKQNAMNESLSKQVRRISKIENIYSLNATSTAIQTEDVVANSSSWVDIPGANLTLESTLSGTANIYSNGSLSALPAEPETINHTHCGIRLVFNGDSSGDEVWGDQIIGCAVVNEGESGWWCPWSISKQIPIKPGTNTFKLQLAGWQQGQGTSCQNVARYFSAAKLSVSTKYDL